MPFFQPYVLELISLVLNKTSRSLNDRGPLVSLFTITKYTGYDPDINLRTSGNDNQDFHMGIDEGAYPTAKSFMLGIRLKF